MAIVSGSVIFDRDRSATISSVDSGIANIPVVLQNINTNERLTVLTDTSGNYAFINVPDGSYRIVESFGTAGGVPTPADYSAAMVGDIPQGVNPPITAAVNPPPGSTNLDSVTPNTLFVTVSGADMTNQNFLNGPVRYTPIETILDPCAVISGENLIDVADDGTFGFFPQGTPANTGVSTEPYPDVTPDFTYVLPNPDVYTPFGGEYTVQNIMNNALSTQIGAWWRIADHTTGNETGRMMVVNGDNPGAVFFRDVVTVQPNTNYLFTSWILNLFRTEGYPNPELGVRIRDENGNILYSETLGTLIPVNVNVPEWKEIGSVINSQNNTSLIVEFSSEGPEVIGNDYAIDDVSLNEIEVPQFIPVKTADRQIVNVGETVRYTITLTNTCSSPLTDLFFQDIVPDGLSFIPESVTVNNMDIQTADPNLGFMLPDLPGGETVTISFLAVADRVPMPSPALNSASIRYFYTPVEGGIPGEFNVISNEVPVQVNGLADISVVKTADPNTVEQGEILTYTITVTNAGPSPAENVMLTDNISTSLSGAEFSVDGITFFPWSSPYALGTLEPGDRRTILVRGMVNSTAGNEIVNTAIVDSITPDPDLDNNASTVVTPVIPVAPLADISVVKTAYPSPVRQGELLTYTLTIANAGPSDAENVELFDNIAENLIDVEFSLNGGITWEPWTGTYYFDMLAAQNSIAVLIRGVVAPSVTGSIENRAIVRSTTPDLNQNNNTSTVNTPIQIGTDLSIQKTAYPDSVRPYQRLTYILTVTNHGPETAQQVTIRDIFPSELCNPVYSVDGGQTWQPWTDSYRISSLPAYTSVSIRITSVVSPCAKCNICNTAFVSSFTPDSNLCNNTASTVVCICKC